MSPILGIYASQISGHLAAPGSYYSIATQTVSGATSSVTFSSIPSTYTHLQLRITALGGQNGNSLSVQFNGDTGTSYSYHYVTGNGSSVSAGGYAGGTSLFGDAVGWRNGYPAALIVDIFDYTNTNKNKTARALNGTDANGSGEIALNSSAWYSTSAINAIRLYSGGTFNTGTFALYGVN